MEALLEKEADVESWNDERLDELSRRMDAGFEKAATKVELSALKNEMNLRFDEFDARWNRFERSIGGQFNEVSSEIRHLSDRFDRLLNTLTVGLIGVVAALLANGFWG